MAPSTEMLKTVGWHLLFHATLIILMKIYASITYRPCKSKAKMTGKTVIVTGATGGIGKETALDIAQRGGRVILACRNMETAAQVRDEIIEETGNSEVVVKKLDLSSLDSVREFAADVNATESRLDVLIHNAGVAYTARGVVTKDGLDKTMATNHFGPFLLTHLLIDLLKGTASSRIVIVASAAYIIALPTFTLKMLNPVRFWFPGYLYFYSKYVNIMFSHELARQLEHTGITVNCLHPGVIATGIWRRVPFPLSAFLYPYLKCIFKTPKEGAQTTIHCAVSEELEGVTGKYFNDCQPRSVTSGTTNPKIARKMWELSERWTLKDSDPRIRL